MTRKKYKLIKIEQGLFISVPGARLVVSAKWIQNTMKAAYVEQEGN